MEYETKTELCASNRLSELREGDAIVTPEGDISQMEMPNWFDKEKFNKAKEVYKNYFACVNFSHLCGLLLSFYFSKNIKTLRSTGESETTRTLFHRYLATIRHIQKWYEGNVWDVNDPAHRSLATVRSMHAKVAAKMSTRKDGLVYVSQWDMAVTQWAFVGPMVLFPTRVGLHGCSSEEYEALIHFWRTIGYLLGIEDQYNLCDGTYEQAMAACKIVFKKEYRELVRAADPTSVDMAENVVGALSKIEGLLTWGSLSTYIHDLVDVPCPVKMNIVDRICYYVLQFVLVFLVQFPGPRAVFNDFFRWKLHKAENTKFRAEQKDSKNAISNYVSSVLQWFGVNII